MQPPEEIPSGSGASPPAGDELHPFVLWQQEADAARVALWQLADGQRAVALFHSAETAAQYCATAGLEPSWQALRPERPVLLALFRACLDDGIRFAVLEPDARQARRIYDLQRIVQQAAGTDRDAP
jgi:hypothetical protein